MDLAIAQARIQTLFDLAERCEVGPGSWELSVQIELAMNPEISRSEAEAPFDVRAGDDHPYIPPSYTQNLLAAMLLIPAGWEWSVSNRAKAPHTGRAHIHNGQSNFCGVGFRKNPDRRHAELTALTPALALCAVCLRAHAMLIHDSLKDYSTAYVD